MPGAPIYFLSSLQLARQLQVSSKTIQRMIDQLKSENYPILSSNRGYAFAEPVDIFDKKAVNQSEQFALYMASQWFRVFRDSPYAKAFVQLQKKLFEKLDVRQQVAVEEAASIYSFRVIGAVPGNWDVFKLLESAIRQHRYIEFNYLSDFRREAGQPPILHRVRPFHLRWVDGKWYLLAGLGAEPEQFRQYSVNRLQALTVLKNRFTPYPREEIAVCLDRETIAAAQIGEERPVAIRLWGWALIHARERRWHSRETWENQADGAAILRFPAVDLREVRRLVMSWCGSAQALEPEDLVVSIRNNLRQMREVYGE